MLAAVGSALWLLLTPVRLLLSAIHSFLYGSTWETSYPRARTMAEPKPPSEQSGKWTLRTNTGDSPLGPVQHTLNGHLGRQLWHFDKSVKPEPWEAERLGEYRAAYAVESEGRHHSADEPYRLQCLRATGGKRRQGVSPPAGASEAARVEASLRSGIGFYGTLQMGSGHWPGDYGGPMFLLPGLVIACYVTETELPEPHRFELLRYLRNHQNADSGVGLHIEGHSTMFGTSLNYVAARLLGLAASEPYCVRARAFMHARGGAVNNTSWAKFWLALLGVYEWRGLNPLPPEMWILPYWLIVHPGRFWCHCRMVYLPMSYLYGRRAACPQTPLTEALRSELYNQPYDQIEWEAHRNNCGPEDMYVQHSAPQDALWAFVSALEPWIPSWLRERALRWCGALIAHEDDSTRFVDIGPVNKAINTVCRFYEDPTGEGFRAHLPRLFDYLWLAEDGMKMNGYNGSQLWDTAFAAQAIVASGLAGEKDVAPMLRKAHAFIDVSQVGQGWERRWDKRGKGKKCEMG
jgi:cycloartenol synthase